MPSLNMQGPYSLTEQNINAKVMFNVPGNYALGHTSKEDNKFIVQYVGRSDTDVNGRLKQHLNEKFKEFKWSQSTSPKAAFEKECQNYHDFGEDKKLENKIHPDRPKNTNWKCPVCDIFE